MNNDDIVRCYDRSQTLAEISGPRIRTTMSINDEA